MDHQYSKKKQRERILMRKKMVHDPRGETKISIQNKESKRPMFHV
jgi:hypothetical protein